MKNFCNYINSLSIYFQRRLLVILALGFVSGLPLALTASTLSVWLAEEKVSLTSIGLLAVVGTPYTLKFLWSPLIDGMKIPLLTKWLGKRRAWLLVSEAALIASLIALGLCNPAEKAPSITFFAIFATPNWLIPFVLSFSSLGWLAVFALFVAIASATQDIVIDAYRVEILPQEEQGAGAAMAVLGYRLGMVVSAAGALYIATYFGWAITYITMAALVPIGMIAVLVGGEPNVVINENTTHHHQSIIDWVQTHIISPFTDFMKRDAWLGLLLFILLYKLGDAFLGVMTNPFLVQLGFSKIQIANVVKLYGVIATIIGSLIGGMMVARIGMVKTLFICGAFHALTNLMFVVQAKMGADTGFLALSISLENISGGMGMSAFVAFLGSLVNKQFTATQYALLSSFSAFGRTWLATPAGWFAEKLGWEWFFILSVALAFPSLIVLWWLKKKIKI